jgi:Outer membrane protein beta-barrel domain
LAIKKNRIIINKGPINDAPVAPGTVRRDENTIAPHDSYDSSLHVLQSNKMKKIILSIGIVGLAATGSYAQVTFGPEIGGTFAGAQIRDSLGLIKTNLRSGFTVGGIVEFCLSDNVYLQPGIFYVMNGFKYSADDIEFTERVSTIQIPINLQYKFGDPGGNRVFIGISPFLGYNLSGKLEASANFSGTPVSSSQSLRIGSDSSNNIRRFDAGVGFNAGYEFSNGVFFRAAYQVGVLDLRPMGDPNNFQRSSHFGITAGFLFGKNGDGNVTETSQSLNPGL